MEKAKVYFTKDVSSNGLLKVYEALNISLKGNVAIKLHSGEKGNQNFVKPEFVKPLIDKVNGTVVECNTAYNGARNTTKRHTALMEEHGWSKYFNVDIMDDNKLDLVLDIEGGKVITKNYVGSHISNYDSMLVLSHFKGHPMGGFGGALKQLSIGCASSRGKAYIHSAGKTSSVKLIWANIAKQEDFINAMAEAASSVAKMFEGNMAYVTMIVNLSVDCDCVSKAEDPCMKDIGIVASLDPIAIDQACIDLVYNSKDPGRDHFVERVESRKGRLILDRANELGFGTKEYELIDIDK